jgi:transposase
MGKDGRVTKRVRRFGTKTHELRNLREWLTSQDVKHVAMESTGVYWKPVWNVLEEGPFELLLCNARDVKNVPGRKTDVKDCEWIAQLLQHGLLRGSFVPSRGLRNLRDLTRARTKLIEAKTANANRLQKTLEDANIKLASVASDPLGKSGRAMIEAIIRGEDDPKRLAELAKQQLRAKIPELRFALEGRVTEHHRFMLRLQYDEILHLEGVIAKLDDRIAQVMGNDVEGTVLRDDNLLLFSDPEDPRQDFGPSPDPPDGEGARAEKQPPSRKEDTRDPPRLPRDDSSHPPRGSVSPFDCLAPAVHLLCSIPGIKQRGAENILAETGGDMSQFPTADNLTSWAGVSPGNNNSAGKSRSGKTTKGNKFLKRALTQAAWVAGRTKGTYFQAQYRRIASRRGKKRALVAVARSLLVTIYYMLERGVYYEELGADYFDRLNSEHLTRYHVKRLTDLGYDVILDEAA